MRIYGQDIWYSSILPLFLANFNPSLVRSAMASNLNYGALACSVFRMATPPKHGIHCIHEACANLCQHGSLRLSIRDRNHSIDG